MRPRGSSKKNWENVHAVRQKRTRKNVHAVREQAARHRSRFYSQRRVTGHLRSGDWLGEGQAGVAREGIRSPPSLGQTEQQETLFFFWPRHHVAWPAPHVAGRVGLLGEPDQRNGSWVAQMGRASFSQGLGRVANHGQLRLLRLPMTLLRFIMNPQSANAVRDPRGSSIQAQSFPTRESRTRLAPCDPVHSTSCLLPS